MENNEIRIIYGKDAAAMTTELIESIPLADMIGDRAAKIVIKPNLVVPAKPESGATTHMGIITALIEYLQDHDFSNITIAEGSWVGSNTEDAFRINGYYKIRDTYGVKLIDTKKDKFRKMSYDGLTMEVSETMLNADFLINLPVLKGHCQTLMTCCLKNMKGCLSDRSKRDFHRWGLMQPIAALNMLIKPSLHIIDSISGDLDFEEGGNPVETDRMIIGTDPVLLDSYGASLMGFSAEEIEYIPIAAGYGRGSMDTEDAKITELNKPEAGSIRPTGAVSRLASHTAPDMACSACYASLIHALKRLEENGGMRKLGSRKVACGQGWKGKTMEIGSGICCSGATHSVKGCPPSASDILAMLERL